MSGIYKKQIRFELEKRQQNFIKAETGKGKLLTVVGLLIVDEVREGTMYAQSISKVQSGLSIRSKFSQDIDLHVEESCNLMWVVN